MIYRMKNTAILLMLMLLVGMLPAQTVTVTAEDMNGTAMEFEAPLPGYTTTMVGGQRFGVLTMPHCIQGGMEGMPSMPMMSAMVEVPVCETVRVVVKASEWDTLSLASLGCNEKILPVQPSRRKDDWSPSRLVEHQEAYADGRWIGDTLVQIKVLGVARVRRLAQLTFSPVRLNARDGKLMVCRHAVVEVLHEGVDAEATRKLQSHYSAAFHYGGRCLNTLPAKSAIETAPIRYLIVANPLFRGQLDSLLHWKQRKGFLADIVYTDNPSVGTTAQSIAQYLKSQYDNATPSLPAPTYVLLVGDVAQLPAFPGVAFYPNHPTDLYYATWTEGDHIPDCHYGRFSAQNVSQLVAQIDKTLTYEQYGFEDASFLGRALLVSGIDNNTPSYAEGYADPAMDYLAIMYANANHGLNSVTYYKNNPNINPQAAGVSVYSNVGATNAMRGKINEGVGLTCYSGHGTTAGWYSPSLYFNNVNTLTNYGKYGVMIGNCCLSNKYDDDESLGEALLRRLNAGGVAYVGASNSTHWMQDFFFAVGVRTNISSGMNHVYNPNYMGSYDCLFHTHNEPFVQHCNTMGAMVMSGVMAIQNDPSTYTSADLKHYYWEIYNLMGDPSLMPWLHEADTLSFSVTSSTMAGTATMDVQTVPYAFVALTKMQFGERVLVASGYANAMGVASLDVASGLYAGQYELAISAQNYIPRFAPLQIDAGEGANVEITQILMPNGLEAGDSVMLNVMLRNEGTATARHGALTLLPNLAGIPSVTIPLDTIAVGETMNVVLPFRLPETVADQAELRCIVECSWDSCPMPSRGYAAQVVAAPHLMVALLTDGELSTGTPEVLTLSVVNNGHAPLNNATLHFSQPLPLIALTASDTMVSIPVGATLSKNYSVVFDGLLPPHTELPFFASLTTAGGFSFASTQTLTIGVNSFEDFESGNLSAFPWVNATNPWEITSTEVHSGTYSARSKTGLANNGSSDLTISWNCAVADSITFFYKISSEPSDMFYFMIDGMVQMVDCGTGNAAWQRVAYAVAPGTHTYLFRYIKDFMMTGGSDCVWIDDIHFPSAPVQPRELVYSYDTICQYAPYTYDGQTVNTTLSGQANYGRTLPNGDIEVLELTILPRTESFAEAVACDIYLWNDRQLTQGGDFADTLVSVLGCDSVLHLHLTLYQSGYDTLYVDTTATEYFFNGQSYTASGTYAFATQTLQGCDSVVTLVLTLTQDTTSEGITTVEAQWNVALYPNPVVRTICFSERMDWVWIYNMQGLLVRKEQQVEQMDVAQLPKGSYVVVVERNGTKRQLKLEKR